MSPKMSRKRPLETRKRPAQSSGCRSVAAMLTSLRSVSRTAVIPIGTLTKKIHSQPKPSVSTPPISGPIATAPPTVAPQAPMAVARSLPSNSWAISASAVANIAPPPTPCRPRARLSRVASPEIPHRKDATVNSPKPTENTRRRPSRSPSEPAIRRKVARVSA
jgi:hypothetical protein